MKQEFSSCGAAKTLYRQALSLSITSLTLIAANQPAFPQDITPVPPVSVTTPAAAPAEGSEAAGYRPKTVSNVGPLGQIPILDTPYSVNVISWDLIENTLAASQEDVFKISPVVHLITPNDRSGTAGFTLRGFNAPGVAEDGIRIGSGSATYFPFALVAFVS